MDISHQLEFHRLRAELVPHWKTGVIPILLTYSDEIQAEEKL